MEYDYRKDLHGWFGLSYAAFVVMPRVAMMQMPKEWQEKMAELLHEYDETINTGAFGVHSCFVTVKDENNKFMSMPEQLVNYRHPHPETKRILLKKGGW
ncbi:hypothetical protein vBKpnSCarvaje_0036 [Klebsiella phage vB_KpnS-Carvaje]|uniref:Uncharacterized protein n=1 Tax=Klebsiella phage vB_KpnS-Carvaje TaxID=2900314 RepID=A0AAE9CKG7_9CAUD|nr:hypothetical protein PQD67_gp036 [Klebsiella phage vB_KpnS-Carvaje]UJQ44000.1 hypothetical protein vBKpnSCarvaje_0036 [Klebsiella phage vB_KpnS-Carvaje]